MSITEDQLAKLAALHAAASGKWYANYEDHFDHMIQANGPADDVAFLTAAHEALPDLIKAARVGLELAEIFQELLEMPGLPWGASKDAAKAALAAFRGGQA